MSGLLKVQVLLFLIVGFFTFLFVIGYHTRFTTFILWFLITSFHVRSEIVLDGSDQWIRLMLFWCIFIPLGSYYSVDSALNSSKDKPPKSIFSAGTLALLIQFFLVYWVTVFLKWNNAEWTKGNGVYYTLSEAQHVTRLGVLMLNIVPLEFLKYGTYFVLWLETI